MASPRNFLSSPPDLSVLETQLRLEAAIDLDGKDLWAFTNLSDPIACRENGCSETHTYIQHLKAFWRPHDGLEIPHEWTSLILPPGECDLELWFPLSLMSTILAPLRAQLRLTPTADFARRPPQYMGPQFPLQLAPEPTSAHLVAAMAKALLHSEDVPALYRLAPLFDGTYNCQMKVHPATRFAGAEPQDIVFALVPEPRPTSEIMARRFRDAPLRLLSPAIVIAVELEDLGSVFPDLTEAELQDLARVTQPHLEALLVARHQRCVGAPPATLPASEPPAAPACIFCIAFRDATLFILAHTAHLHREKGKYRYEVVLVDRLPFPPRAANDSAGVLARLRTVLALLTLRSHADRIAALWHDVAWPHPVWDAEAALVRTHTGIVTPSPSEHVNSDDERDRIIYDYFMNEDDSNVSSGRGPDGELEVDEAQIDPTPSEIARSKELVEGWIGQDV
ncbi:hypothetical protein B0H15DRAFT_950714 [Mycena belliarum]|uniref:Uncharacterized protein n=1 Tax=Mycena belliarum TaxID=1033014 RepID=A0AAD6U1Y4_9AGAR|nr:hypothetical protein B0H15DRAFT_950714 [Mycena belliae]